jgi:RNA polymerase sigma factor (sigma-70 family)
LRESKLSASTVSKESTVTRSDAELIQACLDRDETAWKELVERYGRLVYSIPLRYGLSGADADDVFQNVFTIVLRRLGSLRNQASLTAWLITITQRESQRQGKGSQPHDELDETVEDATTPPPEQVQTWERQHIVHQTLDQLDPRCRELLKALFLETTTVSYDKIAKRLGIPLGSIGPTRARCFKKLESIMTAMGVDGSF